MFSASSKFEKIFKWPRLSEYPLHIIFPYLYKIFRNIFNIRLIYYIILGYIMKYYNTIYCSNITQD